MFNKLDEKRLSKNDFKTKVCAFNGSTIAEMYFYLEPLLKKEPEYLILHVGTNDCVHTPGNEVFCNLLGLKLHIENKVSGIRVILSQPIARTFSPGEKFIISLNPDALPFYPLSHLTCNIRRPNSPTLNPTMEKSFKLNPEAKVFFPKEAHILVPPLYPRQPSHDISVNNDLIGNAGLQPSI